MVESVNQTCQLLLGTSTNEFCRIDYCDFVVWIEELHVHVFVQSIRTCIHIKMDTDMLSCVPILSPFLFMHPFNLVVPIITSIFIHPRYIHCALCYSQCTTCMCIYMYMYLLVNALAIALYINTVLAVRLIVCAWRVGAALLCLCDYIYQY